MTENKLTYSDKLKNPKWQKKRLKILERDNFTCQNCEDSKNTLMVHHRIYLKNAEPWDYPNELLVTLCESCHELEVDRLKEAGVSLLEELQKKFLSDEICMIIDGFLNMKLLYKPSIVARVLFWVLCDENIQKMLVKKYNTERKKAIDFNGYSPSEAEG